MQTAWIIGSGYMATEYYKVLNHLNIETIIVGRGDESASKFELINRKTVIRGGIERFAFTQEKNRLPDFAVVAVRIEHLINVVELLIETGIKKILVEKPLTLSKHELIRLFRSLKSQNVELRIAYNRRFYSSVYELENQVKSDGGVVSAHLEFTEWPDKIDITKYSKSVLNKWIIANSSHVIDLFFHLIGKPTELSSHQSGGIEWHSNGSKFWGSGLSNRNVTFDYYSDWKSDGSWKIKLKTKNKLLVLKPLEELNMISDKGIIFKPELDDYYDRLFKPGLYKMMKDFLENDGMRLCSIEEQIEMFDTYYAIGDYVE